MVLAARLGLFNFASLELLPRTQASGATCGHCLRLVSLSERVVSPRWRRRAERRAWGTSSQILPARWEACPGAAAVQAPGSLVLQDKQSIRPGLRRLRGVAALLQKRRLAEEVERKHQGLGRQLAKAEGELGAGSRERYEEVSARVADSGDWLHNAKQAHSQRAAGLEGEVKKAVKAMRTRVGTLEE